MVAPLDSDSPSPATSRKFQMLASFGAAAAAAGTTAGVCATEEDTGAPTRATDSAAVARMLTSFTPGG